MSDLLQRLIVALSKKLDDNADEIIENVDAELTNIIDRATILLKKNRPEPTPDTDLEQNSNADTESEDSIEFQYRLAPDHNLSCDPFDIRTTYKRTAPFISHWELEDMPPTKKPFTQEHDSKRLENTNEHVSLRLESANEHSSKNSESANEHRSLEHDNANERDIHDVFVHYTEPRTTMQSKKPWKLDLLYKFSMLRFREFLIQKKQIDNFFNEIANEQELIAELKNLAPNLKTLLAENKHIAAYFFRILAFYFPLISTRLEWMNKFVPHIGLNKATAAKFKKWGELLERGIHQWLGGTDSYRFGLTTISNWYDRTIDFSTDAFTEIEIDGISYTIPNTNPNTN
jgi:hypothetical protein